jgi:hypothetical protein
MAVQSFWHGVVRANLIIEVFLCHLLLSRLGLIVGQGCRLSRVSPQSIRAFAHLETFSVFLVRKISSDSRAQRALQSFIYAKKI